jgi:hypothetical protein
MSLEVWLQRGRKVEVGGRELYMMPLPLTQLFSVGKWLEENSGDVLQETIKNTEPGKVPNPLVLVTRVLMKVDMSEVALKIFSYPRNPDTKECLNGELTKDFFDEYLDIPTAHRLFNDFIALNQLEELLKNLQSLPVIKKLMEAASLTFGIPYLSSLQQSTDSTPNGLEGSHSHKSMDSLEQTILEKQGLGTPSSQAATATLQ